MKNIICAIALLSSMNAFAAEIKSNNFTINLEFNKHSDEKSSKVGVNGSCSAYSILGYTDCSIIGKGVVAQRVNENLFSVPGFLFKSKTSGYLVSEYEMNAFVLLKSGEYVVTLYGYQSDKSSLNLTNALKKYFETPTYITTVPAFDFESQGKLVSSKVTNPKLKSLSVRVDYTLIDEEGNPIKLVEWGKYSNSDYVQQDSKIANGITKTSVGKKIFATKKKPGSLKVEVNYVANYFGKNKTVLKEYTFEDLDNIDFANAIKKINLEIADENIE